MKLLQFIYNIIKFTMIIKVSHNCFQGQILKPLEILLFNTVISKKIANIFYRFDFTADLLQALLRILFCISFYSIVIYLFYLLFFYYLFVYLLNFKILCS